jgi:hypothetical protein
VNDAPVVAVAGVALLVILASWMSAQRWAPPGTRPLDTARTLRWFFVIVVLVAIGVLLWVLFFQSNGAREIPYSGGPGTFLGYVKEGRVDRVIQRGADLAITLTDGTPLASRVPSEVSTNVPSDIEATCGEADAHCVPGKPEVSAEEPSQTGQILTLLLTALLPVILIGAIFFFMTQRFRGDGSSTSNRPRGAKERLAELDDLRSRGVISEQEYAAKRRQILDEL